MKTHRKHAPIKISGIDLDSLPASTLLSDEQAVEILGVKKNTLCVWRSTGRVHLPYVKIGRLVRYRAGDLKAFIERRTRGAEV